MADGLQKILRTTAEEDAGSARQVHYEPFDEQSEIRPLVGRRTAWTNIAPIAAVSITISLLGLFPLSIAKVIMGVIYARRCSVESMVIVYLLVSGVLEIGSNIPMCMCYREARERKRTRTTRPESALLKATRWIWGLAKAVVFTWAIIGSVFVSRAYRHVNRDLGNRTVGGGTSNRYCHGAVLNFAVVSIILDFVLYIGVPLIVSASVGIFLCLSGIKKRRH